MPARSIHQARRRLEEMASDLNPAMYKRLNDEIKAAERTATQVAADHARRKTNRLNTERQDVLRRMCETRDGFTALAKARDRLSAGEYTERFNALKTEQRRLQAVAQDVEADVAAVEAIGQDPVAYTDANFYDRYPATKPECSF